MRILLTGRSGQVGYELERSLQGLGEVVALDRAGMDLSNLDQVRETILGLRPALIVNPAAYTAVDRAESEPELAMRINGEAPAVMAEAARRIGAAMIHYSTDYVFDGSKPGPYSEDDATAPINVYGRTKLAGEQAIEASGIPYLIFRTSWVYGARGHNFLLTMQRLARERDELRIVADQTGAPTWCRTIADTTAHVVTALQCAPAQAGLNEPRWREKTGLYHLAAQGQTTWHGFAQTIVAHGSSIRKPRVLPITTQDYPLPARRPANSVLSCDKLIREFCGLPAWDDALKLCLE
ncbi:dTDP-4-dehydrorhamnose reductase [Noviherbaspirillum sp. CPCC 100848]|uniref:dTDP-4-dehydrorhamnose reductase n=1 Tax=Noviherbaspirillum album TaxID=3080276 RepID=A0ABU6J6J8_9BURK|nr:dTDP-4-dehydrorhamnose reductase [Noviherbaspirillum sp. CPCC 100848]MEC4719269.1 dTDP-4-dehydrorhamnose reductase [Noviherbaspirillum sp. CPCC 100848]